MYEICLSISCFDNEVGGGLLLGVVLARQMLLLHALLSAHPPAIKPSTRFYFTCIFNTPLLMYIY